MKFDIDSLNYNPLVEQIVQILKTKTQQNTDNFFRLQTNFYLSLVASLMNVKINSPITGKVPINFYGINLATSGSGKGFASNVLENEILKDFRTRFLNELFPLKAELELDLEANRRHKVLGVSPQEALDRLQKEFKSYGSVRFINSEATTPAIKQYRNLLLLAKLGSVNILIDEIGFNLSKSEDLLHTFLELYDKGYVKEKLTKNTETSSRYKELIGSTPANLLMFV